VVTTVVASAAEEAAGVFTAAAVPEVTPDDKAETLTILAATASTWGLQHGPLGGECVCDCREYPGVSPPFAPLLSLFSMRAFFPAY
jgi:hypothetical protein